VRATLSYEIKLDSFRLLVRRGWRCPAASYPTRAQFAPNQCRCVANGNLGSPRAPELSKSESWKLTLRTWCVADHPANNGAYIGMARDECGENEAKLIIGENGYTWERDEALSCRYSSGKARFNNTIAASTKAVGVWVFHIVAVCIRKRSEGVFRKYTHRCDMYVSKGSLWIENLRSDKNP
jgi:hypothetical protein